MRELNAFEVQQLSGGYRLTTGILYSCAITLMATPFMLPAHFHDNPMAEDVIKAGSLFLGLGLSFYLYVKARC